MKITGDPRAVVIEITIIAIGVYMIQFKFDNTLINMLGIIVSLFGSYALGISAAIIYITEKQRKALLEMPK